MMKSIDTRMGAMSGVEALVNRAFTSKYNPLFYLGQISVFLLVLVAVSGIYMLPFYRINAEKAYVSVEEITDSPVGGLMRSIHRYAADALVVVLLLHGIRTLITRRLLQSRWVVWVSGVLLFGVVMVEGLTGYWMVWDQRAQFVALTLTEFLDVLPVFPKPLGMAVAGEGSLTNLLFFAVVFIHLALPLFSMALVLLHFSRLSRARVLPPRLLGAMVGAGILGVSLLKPAVSAPPAELTTVPVGIPADWFYMFPLPLIQSHPYLSWVILAITGAALLAAPRIMSTRWVAAEVRRDECVGCELCYADCPYGAVSMVREGKPTAVVSKDRCAGCGVCVGSCSFGAVEVDGINLEVMRRRVRELAEGGGSLVILCEHCLSREGVEKVRRTGAKVLTLRCLGMLHPSAVADALEAGARVVLAGCKQGDCRYRLGNLWTHERLVGRRAPVLRHPKAGEVEVCWLMPGEEERLITALKGRRKGCGEEKPSLPLALMLALIFLLPLWYLSTSPAYSMMQEDRALLLFTMSHFGERMVPCREPTVEELRAGNLTPCPRERFPVEVEVLVDGRMVLHRSYAPSGIWRDGPSYAYEKLPIEPGEHLLVVRVRDSGEKGFGYTFERRLMFREGRVVLVRFEKGRFSVGGG